MGPGCIWNHNGAASLDMIDGEGSYVTKNDQSVKACYVVPVMLSFYLFGLFSAKYLLNNLSISFLCVFFVMMWFL